MSVFGRKRGKREIEDVATGERIYAVVEVRKNFIQEEYFCMFQHAAKEIAKDKELVGEDLRVLHLLYGYLDMKNYISISQTDIAIELDMVKQNVNRSINNLLLKEIIIKGPKVGKSWTYILNANYGYKGKLRYLKTERKRHLSLIEEQETDRDVMENLKNKEKENNKKELSDAEKLIKNKKHPTLF